jgi:hypothetical protein
MLLLAELPLVDGRGVRRKMMKKKSPLQRRIRRIMRRRKKKRQKPLPHSHRLSWMVKEKMMMMPSRQLR